MTSTHILAVVCATLAQFIVGAVWYTPLFGKLWGTIHGFDKLDKKAQQKMMSQMGPIFAVQISITIVTSIVFVIFHRMMTSDSLFTYTFLIWLGFVVPAHISGILFGGTKPKWMVTKSAIMAGGSLVALFSGAAVVRFILG